MRPARPLVLAAALVLLAVVLGPRLAAAHEFRPALVRVEQRPDQPGRWDLRLVAPAMSEAGAIAAGELTPIVPEHCALTARSELAFTLDCGERGLVGPLGVAGLDRHPIDVIVELRYADATRTTTVLGPAQPTLTLASPSTATGSVFGEYLGLGVEHILIGLDHLLFVLGLVLLVRAGGAGAGEPRLGPRGSTLARLLTTVTAFTLAHSLTLAASSLELVAVPSAPVEAGIALSIVLLARELALGGPEPEAGPARARERDTLTWRSPWLVAFGFGLLHGFGFAGALREIGLPPSQAPVALLAFNLGVELGQLAVVAAILLTFAGLGRLARVLALSPERELLARRAPIWAMGALAFAWMVERVLGFWG